MGITGSRISLLQAEPDLGRFLSAEEREAAARTPVPVTRLARGSVDLEAVLAQLGAFGALVLDGMLFSHHRVGEQTALRLLGPGDVLGLPAPWRSVILSETTLSAAAPTTLAVFGDEVLLAARRWPRIVAGFHLRMAEQAERVAAQLAICQIPRVDERLLAVMWLLAESWGHVTPAGTRLPLHLTHDMLGALVGARRPTVTLALGELAERGAVARQDRGWLLLEAPVEAVAGPPGPPDQAVLIGSARSAWEAAAPPGDADRHDELVATVKRLREEHLVSREAVRSRLAELRALRDRTAARRRQIAEEAVRRRGAPS